MDIADKWRGGLGISEHAWNEAKSVLGNQMAAVAFAVIAEKHASGEVRSPGGYLRGMVEKARIGTLNLDRTIFGLAQNQNIH